VAQLYAVDAKLLPPNGPIVEGREAIQTFWANAITAGLKIQSIIPIDVATGGNIAVDRGTYASTIPAAGGGTAAEGGKYIVVWKRQGRGWKIAYDIWNSNKPLP
jgi:ketosteroid isomerase-like protein